MIANGDGRDAADRRARTPVERSGTTACLPLRSFAVPGSRIRQPFIGGTTVARQEPRDQRTLYTCLQSTLDWPLRPATGVKPRNQRTIRFLAVDARSGRPTAEYVYEMDPWQNYSGAASQGDMKISELVMIDRHRLLVEERTDASIKLFVVDLRRPATNILGSTWDDEATLPSLEQVSLAANGIVPLTKTKVFDQDAEGVSLPGKIEGIAQIIPGVFALINDNDFNIAGTAETTVTYLYLPPTSAY